MSIDVFYFSGTGNSLQVARQIARHVDAWLRPIATYDRQTEPIGPEDALGVVFPVHGFSLPRVVETFLKRVDLCRYEYIFVVSTKGGSPDLVVRDVSRLARRQRRTVDAFFSLSMPNNTHFIHDLDTDDEVDQKVRRAEEDVLRIATVVQLRDKYIPPQAKTFSLTLLGAVHRFLSLTEFGGFGRRFSTTSACTHCGVCVTVCPSRRIVMGKGRVSWDTGHPCYVCSACVNYCPAQAIRNRGLKPSRTQPSSQYHHPAVRALDIAAQTET